MSESDDNSYHALGVIFLITCPLVGASCTPLLAKDRRITLLLNSFATGVLFGVGLLHALPDAVSGIVSDYPAPFLIAGSTTIFLYLVAAIVHPLVLWWYSSGTEQSKATAKSLVSAHSFWCALCVHGCFEGISVGSLTEDDRWITLGALYVHKIVEYSALSTMLHAAGLTVFDWKFWTTAGTSELPCLVCFIVAWLAVANDAQITDEISASGLFSALSGGTFIFLSLGHLLPEVLNSFDGPDLKHHHHHHYHQQLAAVSVPLDKEEASPAGVELAAGSSCDCASAPAEPVFDLAAALLDRVLGFSAIALGWVVFALLALAPGRR